MGPLPLRSLEVLYDARIIDDSTPISFDGAAFKRLGEATEVLARVQEIKRMLVSGLNPWPDLADPVQSTDDIRMSPIGGEVSVEEMSPIRAMFECAVSRSTGYLVMNRRDGVIQAAYSDGKIVSVATTVPSFSIAQFLVAKRVCDQAAIARGVEQAARTDGDLGSAMISLGLVPPHLYVEQHVEWAKAVLGALAGTDSGTSRFEIKDVPPATLPLGLDRLGVLIESARRGFSAQTLELRVAGRRTLLLIPSQVEGATVDELKLDPRELRAFKLIDGAKTVDQLLDTAQGKGEHGLRVVYLTTELGFVVFGDDPLAPKEREEARQLSKLFADMSRQNYYEVLGIGREVNDEEIRARYMAYAKMYHPDKVRSNALPELLDARAKIFALVQEAFRALENERARTEYNGLLAAGVRSKEGEQQVVAAILEAENLFKRAEAQARMRNYVDSLQTIDRAIQLKPDDLEFYIHRIYYEYLTRGEGREPAANDAIRQIIDVLKRDEKIASAYLFLGRLYKAVQKTEQSLKNFKRVLEFDATNHEAQSEIRLANMRRDKDKKKR